MSDAHGHADGEHGHIPHQAHHFDTMQQQFDAGKLGIWLFLITEVLFFSGLFVAYIIYRRAHPEIFFYGHEFLDTQLGFINTAVLLFSSLTMACAVRAAQKSQQTMLIVNLVLTLVCAFGFLGIKYVEYSHKIHLGLLPGRLAISRFNEKYVPHEAHGTEHHAEPGKHDDHAHDGKNGSADDHANHEEEILNKKFGMYSTDVVLKDEIARRVSIFFGIYFCMTGLHAFHVIGGIVVIFWILIRSIRGDFNADYYGPVDYVGLYWHLVDLIWIYLFPLLYLIRS